MSERGDSRNIQGLNMSLHWFLQYPYCLQSVRPLSRPDHLSLTRPTPLPFILPPPPLWCMTFNGCQLRKHYIHQHVTLVLTEIDSDGDMDSLVPGVGLRSLYSQLVRSRLKSKYIFIVTYFTNSNNIYLGRFLDPMHCTSSVRNKFKSVCWKICLMQQFVFVWCYEQRCR